MIQISQRIYCDAFVQECFMPSRLFANPYLDYPYLIIENFLSQEECNLAITEIQNSKEVQKAMVKSTISRSVVVPSVDKKSRSTGIYKLPKHIETLYMKNFAKHQSTIETTFAMALTTSTQIQALEYLTGDFYVKHADDSSEILDKERKCVGFACVAPQRKLTSVLFLSSHKAHQYDTNTSHASKTEQTQHSFDGGELVFNYLYDKDGKQIALTPKAGDMVIFLSNPCFSHEVLPVKSGYRATLVQWHNAI